MAWAIRIERPKTCRIRPIAQSESDRADEATDAREEEFGVAHTRFDFEGSDPEIPKNGRMAQVPEYEHSAKRNEEQSDRLVRTIREPRENRNPRCGRKLRKTPTTSRLITGIHQRQMLEYQEERTDLQPFPAWQRRKVAIDVVG
jgi:FtsZ-interacting cell division protein ZipA